MDKLQLQRLKIPQLKVKCKEVDGQGEGGRRDTKHSLVSRLILN